MRLLACDIGGTNARFVLYEAPEDAKSLRNAKEISSHNILSQRYYKNSDFNSFTDTFRSFVSLPEICNLKIHSCCLAVAGPVANNRASFTNLENWIIDADAIMKEFGIQCVEVINDFVANGYGLLTLSQKDILELQKGKDVHHDATGLPVALVGAGTGLGECFLTPGPDGSLAAFPTEGGHTDFGPRTRLENQLLEFIQRRLCDQSELPLGENDFLPRVSVERVASGMGLGFIYEFLREKFPDQVDNNLDAKYNESREPGALIGAEKHNYSLFQMSLRIMFRIFTREVGNVALQYLPFGGLYIAGGIAPKNIEFFTGPDAEFLGIFHDTGRLSSIMSEFPVYLVLKEDLGLRGAHILASRSAADLLS